MSFTAQIKALAVSAVVVFASTAAQGAAQNFRNDAAEVSAAARLVSAYGVVTSTFRTVTHNKAVGGVPNSYHLLDRAIDVARRPGVTHLQIDAALRRSGYRLIESLDEHDHSHFAFASLSTATPASAPGDASVPPAPPPKPLPRLAADEHGILTIDLGAPARTAASAAAAPR